MFVSINDSIYHVDIFHPVDKGCVVVVVVAFLSWTLWRSCAPTPVRVQVQVHCVGWGDCVCDRFQLPCHVGSRTLSSGCSTLIMKDMHLFCCRWYNVFWINECGCCLHVKVDIEYFECGCCLHVKGTTALSKHVLSNRLGRPKWSCWGFCSKSTPSISFLTEKTNSFLSALYVWMTWQAGWWWWWCSLIQRSHSKLLSHAQCA